MNFRAQRKSRRDGIALIMVMMIIVVFAALAMTLANMMKVETTLARNSSWDMELEWLGRSGIEMAKYVLAQPSKEGYEGHDQFWAGGTRETNDLLADLSLTDNKLGHGTFSVKILDCDRKFNINLAARAPEVMNQALTVLMGVDGAEAPRIVNAIADWIDVDDQPRPGGGDAESSYYQGLNPPYLAKNGPIDDLTELMMIKGITPAMYFGSGGGGGGAAGVQGIAAQHMFAQASRRFNRRFGEEQTYPVGLVDLFTAVGGAVNFNTADANVLQLFPDISGSDAQAIIQWRAGPDGQEGNEDDLPFHNKGQIASVPGLSPEAKQFVSQSPFVNWRSTCFEVEVEAQIDAVKRTYYALLSRQGPQVVLLYMYWR